MTDKKKSGPYAIKHRNSHFVLALFPNLVMLLVSFTCLYPLFWLLYSSLKTQKEFAVNILSFPAAPNLNNYYEVLKSGKMIMYLCNSLFLSIFSVTFIIVLAFVTAYFFARYDFPGKGVLFSLYLLGMLIPPHGRLIPVFIMFQKVHMLDNRFTLLAPYIAVGMPMAVFLLQNFIKTVPLELEESACIDGGGTNSILMHIVFPICKPVVSTVLILSFLNIWNEFPFALVLINSDRLKTITVGLTNFVGMYSVDYPQLMAALVVAALPITIVYLIFGKQVIKGMVAGAVKA